MLISWSGLFASCLVRSLNPVPSTITMATETPAVIERTLISSTSTKYHHHASGRSGLAQRCTVIDSHSWVFFATIEFDPGERCLLNTQAPHITDRFLAGVSTKDKQMRLREDDCVAISAAWCRADYRNDHPLGLFFTVSHIK